MKHCYTLLMSALAKLFSYRSSYEGAVLFTVCSTTNVYFYNCRSELLARKEAQKNYSRASAPEPAQVPGPGDYARGSKQHPPSNGSSKPFRRFGTKVKIRNIFDAQHLHP